MPTYFELSKAPKKPDSQHSLFIILSKNQFLFNEKEARFLFSSHQLSLSNDFIEKMAIYIGKTKTSDIYALAVTEFPNKDFTFIPAKKLLNKSDSSFHSMLQRSLHLVNWDKTSQYCNCCGEKTVLSKEEFVKICIKCDNHMFPQYSPAIIVSITRDDHILLGRSPHFEKGIYSTLAGFVEAGELLEDAVRREVREEVGIEIKNIKYHSSQPWPFPNSVMIGFTAEYKSGDIIIDQKEIEDARWFPYNNLPLLPSTFSISYTLIDEFVQKTKKRESYFYRLSNLQAGIDGSFISIVTSGTSLPFRYMNSSIIEKCTLWGSLGYLSKISATIALQFFNYAMLFKFFEKNIDKSKVGCSFINNPITISLLSGILVGGLRSLTYTPTKKVGLRMYHDAVFSAAFLGSYPLIKREVSGFITNASLVTPVSCIAVGSLYASFLFPKEAYQAYKTERKNFKSNLTAFIDIKSVFKKSIARTLWKSPIVVLASEISYQVINQKACNN